MNKVTQEQMKRLEELRNLTKFQIDIQRSYREFLKKLMEYNENSHHLI